MWYFESILLRKASQREDFLRISLSLCIAWEKVKRFKQAAACFCQLHVMRFIIMHGVGPLGLHNWLSNLKTKLFDIFFCSSKISQLDLSIEYASWTRPSRCGPDNKPHLGQYFFQVFSISTSTNFFYESTHKPSTHISLPVGLETCVVEQGIKRNKNK